jgi:hypothetical protein
MRGGRKPFVVLVTSRIAFALGVVVPMPTVPVESITTRSCAVPNPPVRNVIELDPPEETSALDAKTSPADDPKRAVFANPAPKVLPKTPIEKVTPLLFIAVKIDLPAEFVFVDCTAESPEFEESKVTVNGFAGVAVPIPTKPPFGCKFT